MNIFLIPAMYFEKNRVFHKYNMGTYILLLYLYITNKLYITTFNQLIKYFIISVMPFFQTNNLLVLLFWFKNYTIPT